MLEDMEKRCCSTGCSSALISFLLALGKAQNHATRLKGGCCLERRVERLQPRAEHVQDRHAALHEAGPSRHVPRRPRLCLACRRQEVGGRRQRVGRLERGERARVQGLR